MTEKRFDVGLLKDNLKDLFQEYRYTCRDSFTETCIVEKIYADVWKEINDSYR